MKSPADQAAEAGKPFPGELQTRLSGAWTALVIGIAALVVILVFILQNLQIVEVYFLFFHWHLPLAVALLFAMVLGAVVVMAFGAAGSFSSAWWRDRPAVRRHKKAHQPNKKKPRDGWDREA